MLERTLQRRAVLALISVALFLSMWLTLSANMKPIFFPGPSTVVRTAVQMILDGTLVEHVGVSLFRILTGWVTGALLLGIPIGLVMGHIRLIRELVDPFIEFFRVIPPIAFVTLAMIWFGLGELSKVVLIVYTTLFATVINVIAGVRSVNPVLTRASQCLGASRPQVFFHVVLPATVPYLITAMRIAMGNAFLTIVAAEMIAAESGLGFLIFNSRLFMLTDRIFVAIVSLGFLGLAVDRMFRLLADRLARPYLFAWSERN